MDKTTFLMVSMYQVKQAIAQDIPLIAEIELKCFPKAEAATHQTFEKRFKVFPECFFIVEDGQTVVGHINGSINDVAELPDVLYEKAELHKPSGKYQTVMGLAVAPAYQKNGVATELLKYFIMVSQQRNHHGMILTCKENLIGFYEKHGFVSQGVSASNHGGAQWYKMQLMY